MCWLARDAHFQKGGGCSVKGGEGGTLGRCHQKRRRPWWAGWGATTRPARSRGCASSFEPPPRSPHLQPPPGASGREAAGAPPCRTSTREHTRTPDISWLTKACESAVSKANCACGSRVSNVADRNGARRIAEHHKTACDANDCTPRINSQRSPHDDAHTPAADRMQQIRMEHARRKDEWSTKQCRRS